MTLVLVILAIIWAAVLIPPAIRARAEGRPADSITAFHRQLSVLRRTGPRTGRDDAGGDDRYGHGHVAPVRLAASYGAPVGGRQAHAAAARRNARRRRRDILTGLLATSVCTLLLGVMPALRVMWAVHIVTDVLLIGFVMLLVRQRNVVAERDLKVRLLPTAQGQGYEQAGWIGTEPPLLRRSAN